MTTVCPVCRRLVSVTGDERFVWRHKDTVGNRCPMSGNPFPVSVWGLAA